jgi:hypothetical protein
MEKKAEIEAAYDTYGNIRDAAKSLGISKSEFHRRLNEVKNQSYILPEIPEDDLPVEEIVKHLHNRFQKRKHFKESTRWYNIDMKSDDPIGLLWLGDPHIDDNYCDWDSLRSHLSIIASHTHIYGCSVGDYQNNWVGRLGRLYGEQDTSHKTAWKLVEWLIGEMNPLVLIGGNHDMWSGAGDPLKWISGGHTIREDWEARVNLRFPNGRQCRIHAAHDMSGHSQWNSLHAQNKMARFKGHAELYISGHRHNWGLAQIEDVEKKSTAWLARCRGYKFHDTYAMVKGFDQQNFGQAIFQLIDPQSDSPTSWVQCFVDPQAGADYLDYLLSLRQ